MPLEPVCVVLRGGEAGVFEVLGEVSMRAPIRGLMMAKATMKLLVKRPTLATEAPRLRT